jgi:carbonic anhydrase/acetyltransferase-like protein (isoleucine patch superfamily)
LVTERTRIPAYTLALGSPAKVVRELTERDLARMRATAAGYAARASEYASM